MLWAAVRLFCAYSVGGVADPLSLQEMLVELAACAAREQTRRERSMPRWIRRVAELLSDRYWEPLALADLAAEAQVHPVHLGRTFRKVTGCTMGQRLQQLRVARACQLLSDRDRSLADVAVATGFADQPHFSRVFRRLAGTTPGRFRSYLLREHC
jgi:AraC family transcriptional regulator